MPYVKCPACGGAGGSCGGCNGHGIVEVTSDEEADVVLRGGRLIDRGTNKPGGPMTSPRSGCAPVILMIITFPGTLAWLLGR